MYHIPLPTVGTKIKATTNASPANTHSCTQSLCKPSSTWSKILTAVSLKTYPKEQIYNPKVISDQQYQCLSFASCLEHS